MRPVAPLAGRRIVVTRAVQQARDLITRIEALGGTAIACPVIRTVPPADWRLVDEALQKLDSFDWLFFTSVNGVAFFFQRQETLGLTRIPLPPRIAAVGSKTAEALTKRGVEVYHMPDTFTAEHLVASLKGIIRPGEKVLLARAAIGRAVLPEGLAMLGAEVTDAAVYDTVKAKENISELVRLLHAGQVDMITFTSPSTVRNLLSELDEQARESLRSVQIAVIGPVTAEAVQKAGFTAQVMPAEYSIDGLLDVIVRYTGWK